MADQTKHLPSPYAGLLDLLPFPAALVDTEGHFVYSNEAYLQHPLWQDDAVLEQPVSDTPRPGAEQRRQLHEIYTRIAQRGSAHFHLETIRDDNHTARRYRWLCLPLLDGQDTIDHLLIVEIDEEDLPQGLSDREMKVFEYIGHGHTTQEIAKTMHISPKTVESYRASIKEKLGLEHNTELIRRAFRWMDGDTHFAEPKENLFLGELAQEIRSPLAAIAGLADSLAQCIDPVQAHLADLILMSTQQLIRRLDLKLQHAQHHEHRLTGRP